MAEHGILFSPKMVAAILAGAKTVTRRLEAHDARPGDLLWVREAWAIPCPERDAWRTTPAADVVYGSTAPVPEGWRRRHARFMPKIYARLWLLVEDVREEPLLAIDDADAVREGVLTLDAGAGATNPRVRFAELWDSLHAVDAPWATNPRVFRIAFRRVDAPARTDTNDHDHDERTDR